MAKAPAPAKVKAAPPKKAKAMAVAPKNKAAAKKGAATQMAPAPKKAAAKGKALPPKNAAPKKAAPAKGAPAKVASGKAAPQNAAPKKVAPAAVAPKKAAPQKAAPPKTAAAPKVVARAVAVKKAARRRPATRIAVPTPAPRRGRPPAAVRTAPGRMLSGAGPQVFTVSHLNEVDFKADGLRAYAQYRDLGIAAATAGLCQAHVIRFVPPCTDEVRKRHVHKAELQLVYVLKGWMKNEFEGHGEQMMSTGSCWIQPSGIEHTVLDYSPDCEVLEIIVPADFKTEDV
jgi:hypothetical protein